MKKQLLLSLLVAMLGMYCVPGVCTGKSLCHT